ncbi:hypothetical protein Tco_0765825 [Tanacetum coccineum]
MINPPILSYTTLQRLGALPRRIVKLLPFAISASAVLEEMQASGGGSFKKNKDVFAWQPSNMTKVPKRVIKHTLNANMFLQPVTQKRRILGSEKKPSTGKKVEEWVKAGRNLEAYVDDMAIKSKTENEMLADIAKTFDNLRRINKKLNMKKQFCLSEKFAALNWFLAKSSKRPLLFFETLKNITKENKDEYRWTEDAEIEFQEMKKLIMELPSLTTPKPEETLNIYLVAS